MYGQPSYPSQSGIRVDGNGGGGGGGANGDARGFVEGDKRSLISKKGFRGFFGGAKNGRMAS